MDIREVIAKIEESFGEGCEIIFSPSDYEDSECFYILWREDVKDFWVKAKLFKKSVSIDIRVWPRLLP